MLHIAIGIFLITVVLLVLYCLGRLLLHPIVSFFQNKSLASPNIAPNTSSKASMNSSPTLTKRQLKIMKVVTILVGICIIVFGFLIWSLNNVHVYAKIPGTYLSNIDSYQYTQAGDNAYIRKHGASAHEYFATRPRYYQRVVKIIPASNKLLSFNILAYAANEKGQHFDMEYKAVTATAPMLDLLKYKYQNKPIKISFVDHKKNIGSIVIDPNKPSYPHILLSVPDKEVMADGVGVYFNSIGPNITHTYLRVKGSTNFDDFKKTVNDNLSNKVQKQDEEISQAIKNLKAFYEGE